jgi:hypothetical protein
MSREEHILFTNYKLHSTDKLQNVIGVTLIKVPSYFSRVSVLFIMCWQYCGH